VNSLLELKRREDPDVLFLFETKLDGCEMERFRWMLELTSMWVVKPEGRSRGLAVFWRKELDLSLRSSGRRHIDFDVTEANGDIWRLTGVYGESQSERKKETWKMLRTLGQQHQNGRPWLCLGDFNEILTTDEKCGGATRPQTCMDQFRDALDSCGLGDLGYVGDKFTWRNNCHNVDGYICERLDRATGNSEWCLKFPNFRVINGNPRHSDHRPVIVETEVEERIPRAVSIFRFEARWVREEGCDEVIEAAWRRGCEEGSHTTAQVIKTVATDLTRWSRDVVGDLENRIKKQEMSWKPAC
jgi:exonuclease III